MLREGDILDVRTAHYGPDPCYPEGLRVTRVLGPCTCSAYTDRLNYMGQEHPPPPGPVHYHLVGYPVGTTPSRHGHGNATYHTVSQREGGRWFYTWAVWDEATRQEYVPRSYQVNTQLALL